MTSPTFACGRCWALVEDLDTHTAWHEELDEALASGGSRDGTQADVTQPEPETLTIRRELLQILFDLAANSLDFGSGFWSTEETNAGREVAVLLGLNPMAATPYEFSRQYPHRFEASKRLEQDCHWCTRPAEDPTHLEVAQECPS